ncbi:1961_t:CDS:2, partial [Gigaspora rosea]
MEMLSDEEIEFDIVQMSNPNENVINIESDNEDVDVRCSEDVEETVAYFTTHLAVKADNIYYSTVSVEYPPTSPQNDKGPSGFATIYNVLNLEDSDNDNNQ